MINLASRSLRNAALIWWFVRKCKITCWLLFSLSALPTDIYEHNWQIFVNKNSKEQKKPSQIFQILSYSKNMSKTWSGEFFAADSSQICRGQKRYFGETWDNTRVFSFCFNMTANPTDRISFWSPLNSWALASSIDPSEKLICCRSTWSSYLNVSFVDI